MTGIDVAQVVFVHKRMVEVQYLRATITDAQRNEFEALVPALLAAGYGVRHKRHVTGE